MRDSVVGLLVALTIVGLCSSGILLVNVGSSNAFIYQLQGPVTGVHITHGDVDVKNLFVSTGVPGGDTACGGIIPCGDTDGTGLWTYHAALWNSRDPTYYFTYGGEGYAFHGSVGQITEVKV